MAHEVNINSVNEDGKTRTFNMQIGPRAIWHVANDHEKAILETLDTDSDRAVAIVAASMVEARLDTVLNMGMQGDKIVRERMFQPSGPLGSFSSKIDLCFMVHVISKHAHQSLVKIKDVRNKFAHDLTIKDFNSPAIRDRIRHLSIVDTHIAQGDRKPGGNVMELSRPVGTPFMWLTEYKLAKDNPKDRYLMACSVFVNALGVGVWPATGQTPVI